MRLIDTVTLEMTEFLRDIPKYAILSHTWGKEEITFEDWLYARQQNPPRWGWVYDREEVRAIKAKSGYRKIRNACDRAASDGIPWIWVDTNCINKTSSTELSEAINSMYRWYQNAEVCYAFLDDVASETVMQCAEPGSDFRASRWFTRGWTLQELIAPEELVFFSRYWSPICSKVEMKAILEEITRIPRDILEYPRTIHCACEAHVSIADIMSWASSRTTTKVEDMAYSLMGLFDVNMQLIYGEGNKAFFRLQHEIAQKSRDLTILSWQNVAEKTDRITAPNMAHRVIHQSAFAEHPRDFSFSRRIEFYCEPGETRGLNWSAHDIYDIGTRFLTLHVPLVDTLSPHRKYAVLPYQKCGRALWIPIEGLEARGLARNVRQFDRINWPQATLSVSSTSWTGPAIEIEVAFRSITKPRRYGPTYLPRPVYIGKARLEISVHLTFPAGLGGYERTEQFPRDQANIFTTDSLLNLFVDPGIPGFAFGAIEFVSQYRKLPVAIFFVVEVSLSPQVEIVRWTARDISDSQFDQGHNKQGFHLSNRARSQLSYLISPSCDDDLVPSTRLTWGYQSPLCADRAPGSANDGMVVLDDRVYDVFDHQSVLDGGNAQAGSTPDKPVGPRYVIAQIVFPSEGKEDTSD